MAWTFDGTNDQVDLGTSHADAYDIPDADWTIAGWAKHADGSPATNETMYNVGESQNGLIILVDASGNLDFDWFTTSNVQIDGTGTDFSDTNWHHVVATRSGDDYTIYVDNNSRGTSNNSAANTETTIDVNQFGIEFFSDWWNGSLAEWAKWNRALNTQERQALADGASPLFFHNDLKWYAPMIREYIELLVGETVTNSGSTIGDHPRIFYPKGAQLFAPIASSVTHNPTDAISLGLDATATIKGEWNPQGTIVLGLDATANIAGGIINPSDTLNLGLSSTANIVGDLFNPTDAITLGLDSTATIVGDLFNPTDSLALGLDATASIAGQIFPTSSLSLGLTASANITFGNIVFRWSTENIESSTSHGFPSVYVEIQSDSQPTGAFPTGLFFERRLLDIPSISEIDLSSRSGVSGFQRGSIRVDNTDGLLNGLELQDAFVRVFFVDDDGNVYREFNGKIVDWTLAHQTIINFEDLDVITFTEPI